MLDRKCVNGRIGKSEPVITENQTSRQNTINRAEKSEIPNIQDVRRSHPGKPFFITSECCVSDAFCQWWWCLRQRLVFYIGKMKLHKKAIKAAWHTRWTKPQTAGQRNYWGKMIIHFQNHFFGGTQDYYFPREKNISCWKEKMVKWCKRSLREVSSCPLARELSFYRQKRFFLENWTRLKKVARCPGAGELLSFMKKRQLLKPSPLLSVSSKHYL